MNIVKASGAIVLAIGLGVLGFPSTGQANLISLGSQNLGGAGFGAVTSMSSAQAAGTEQSTITYNGTTFTGLGDMSGSCCNGPKNTVTTLAALGWLTGANVGVGLNSNQVNSSGAITVTGLRVDIYKAGTAAALGSFSIAGPISFTQAQVDAQQGSGNAVFLFGLDSAQRSIFNSLVTTNGTGLLAAIGLFSMSNSNDGIDNILGTAITSSAVPGPIVGAGLPGMMLACGGLIALARRRRQKLA